MPHFPFRHKEDSHHPTGTLLATLADHTAPVRAIAWSPDSRLLASASDDGTLRIWNPESFQSLDILTGEEDEDGIGGVGAVAWSPDGRLLAFSCFNTLLWDATRHMRLQPLIQRDNEEALAGSLAWSPDSRFLASSYDDATISVWDGIAGRKLSTLKGHGQGNIWAVAWSPDGRLLASASQDKTVRLWETHTGQTVALLPTHPLVPLAVAWSPDGRLLASDGAHEPCIWDVSTGQQLSYQWKSMRFGKLYSVSSFAWSPDGRLLASSGSDLTASDGKYRVALWDVLERKCQAVLKGHTERVTAVAWSPDGHLLASASEDQTVRIWSMR